MKIFWILVDLAADLKLVWRIVKLLFWRCRSGQERFRLAQLASLARLICLSHNARIGLRNQFDPGWQLPPPAAPERTITPTPLVIPEIDEWGPAVLQAVKLQVFGLPVIVNYNSELADLVAELNPVFTHCFSAATFPANNRGQKEILFKFLTVRDASGEEIAWRLDRLDLREATPVELLSLLVSHGGECPDGKMILPHSRWNSYRPEAPIVYFPTGPRPVEWEVNEKGREICLVSIPRSEKAPAAVTTTLGAWREPDASDWRILRIVKRGGGFSLFLSDLEKRWPGLYYVPAVVL